MNKAPHTKQEKPPQTTAELLKNADPEQVKALSSRSLALWAQYSGIEVDGRPFEFDKHRYLLPIYLDNHYEVVWQKAAQLGATIYLLLRLLWFCRHYTLKAGLYFPTGEGVEVLSKDRLNPLINSNSELYNNVRSDANTLGLKQIDNVEGRRSSLYMLYVRGRASKDSVPLDVVAFDEVRLIESTDIDQALERISHSSFKYKMFMSTAGLNDMDINARFLRGTQHTWMMRCGCPKTHEDQGYFDPAELWPDSVIETKDGEVFLRCPRCKFVIKDPQNGGYIVRNPRADAHSYRVSQLASRFITLKEIWEFYKTTTHMAEFYNAKLGLPYVDAENRPVSEDVFNACINPEIDWSTAYNDVEKRKFMTAMGVDQHAGNNYVVIVKQGKDGKKELLHLELIEADNPEYWKPNPLTGDLQPVTPFERLKELMYEFNVNMAVVDAMPNANEAQNFARTFPGKAFIAWYRESQGGDIITWNDRPTYKETVKKGSEQIKLKWQVVINRYQGLDFALRQFVDGTVQVPPLSKFSIICRHPKTGRFEHVELAKIFRQHQTRLVRQKTILDETTMRYKLEWAQLGGEAHFAHAWLYTCVAFERLRRRAKFVF